MRRLSALVVVAVMLANFSVSAAAQSKETAGSATPAASEWTQPATPSLTSAQAALMFYLAMMVMHWDEKSYHFGFEAGVDHAISDTLDLIFGFSVAQTSPAPNVTFTASTFMGGLGRRFRTQSKAKYAAQVLGGLQREFGVSGWVLEPGATVRIPFRPRLDLWGHAGVRFGQLEGFSASGMLASFGVTLPIGN